MPHALPDGRKFCSGCSTWKTVADFQRNKAAPDGLQYRCRPCLTADVRHWRMKKRALAATPIVADAA